MIYYFDRYKDGVLMASGAKITKAKSEEEALEIAKSLFREPRTTFKLREKITVAENRRRFGRDT